MQCVVDLVRGPMTLSVSHFQATGAHRTMASAQGSPRPLRNSLGDQPQTIACKALELFGSALYQPLLGHSLASELAHDGPDRGRQLGAHADFARIHCALSTQTLQAKGFRNGQPLRCELVMFRPNLLGGEKLV
jgi:hypothetical protein